MVLFNASVVLAGLRSSGGGSGRLLAGVKQGRIKGVISQLIFDEVLRHAPKLGLADKAAQKQVLEIFKNILPAPGEDLVGRYFKAVIDPGDAHVLASCSQGKCEVLVTLDKRHLLVLQGKVRGVAIMSPGEFLTKFNL